MTIPYQQHDGPEAATTPVNGAAADAGEPEPRPARLPAEQWHLLEAIAGWGTLEDALTAVARLVEADTGRACSIMVAEPEGMALRPAAAPSLPASFTEAHAPVASGPRAGATGAAAYRRAPVITRDVDADPLWSEDERATMARHGLRSAWCTPILAADGALLGTLTTYGAEAGTPDDGQQVAAETGARIAGMAIGRQAFTAMVHVQEERFRRLWETSTDAIVVIDGHHTIVAASPALERTFGYTPDEIAGLHVAVLQPPRLRDAHAEGLARYLETAERRTDWRALRVFGLHKDGHEFPLEVSFCDVSEGGRRLLAGFMRDVTARARAEEALRRSELRYRALAENALDMVCELDAAGRFAYVSPNFTQALGYAPEDLIGQAAFAYMAPEDREPVAAHYADLVAGVQAPGTTRFRFRAKDGAWRWMEASANLFETAEGARHAVVVARDVSDRIEMEYALQESEGRLRTFVANAPGIMFATDTSGVYTLFEGKDVERFGLRAEDYLGRKITDVYPHVPAIAKNLARVLDGESFSDVFTAGTGRHFEVHHAPLRDETGAVTGIMGIIVDVTARVHAEEALRASEERYRQIFSNRSAVRFIADPESAAIVEANDAACEFYGYTQEEMTGMPIGEINTLPAEHLREKLREAVEGGLALCSLQHRLASGEVRDVDVSTGPVQVDGKTLLFSVVHDVTEQRQAQSLVAAQRHLLEMIAMGAGLEQILDELTRTVEKEAPGTLCSILLTSSDGTRLHHASAPSLPDAYNQEVDGLEIGPAAGSCGTAAFRGETVVVTDIEHDPLWEDARELALAHGLRACWSTPITSTSGSVLGTLAIYHRTPKGPTTGERELVDVAAHVAGIAVERRRSEMALRSRTAEMERMYKRLARTHGDLEESKQRLEEKSRQLETALGAERERARRDQLTGSLNHAAITEMLRDIVELHADVPHAVAMVDVDGLKVANDTYGHQIGDAVLVKVASVLARPGATVGRYGGDEFVVIIPGADREAAEEYRRGVLAELANAGLTDSMTGARVPVVASIGVAIYPDEAESVEDLIRLSDSAMYQSRRQRPTGEGDALARPLGGDRAARMVGELVPLLTSPGRLQDKLRLVAHRLSVGAGYDGVNFVLAESHGMESSAFARVPESFLEQWNERARAHVNIEIAEALTRTKRPLIMDDLENDARVGDEERQMLAAAGLKSALLAPMIWENNLIGALMVASARKGAFSVRDAEFVAAVATQVTAIVRMSSLLDQLRSSTAQLQRAHEGTVLMLASAAEAHDSTTGRHLSRVREISMALAREMGYEEDAAQALGLAATLHDIGKIRVPDSVLGSAQSLAEAEWVLMKQHTIWGGAFLAGQTGFELAAAVARYHHERWDGTGYPDGLSGTQIPEGALITTVADSLDAMTSNRPYRAGRPLAAAVEEIVRCSGTQFSPRVVEALVRLYERGELDFVESNGDHEEHDGREAWAA
jgi:diguanylate cyclase (GGDEF)-like protein/PAS domain S-box-containing protein